MPVRKGIDFWHPAEGRTQLELFSGYVNTKDRPHRPVYLAKDTIPGQGFPDVTTQGLKANSGKFDSRGHLLGMSR
jgi:hypothetical protein